MQEKFVHLHKADSKFTLPCAGISIVSSLLLPIWGGRASQISP